MPYYLTNAAEGADEDRGKERVEFAAISTCNRFNLSTLGCLRPLRIFSDAIFCGLLLRD